MRGKGIELTGVLEYSRSDVSDLSDKSDGVGWYAESQATTIKPGG